MEKKLIALYGPAGAGKDYFCKVLDYFYNNIYNYHGNFFDIREPDFIYIMNEFKNNPRKIVDKVTRMAFADPLKESMAIIFQIPLQHLHDTQLKEGEYINMKSFELIDTTIDFSLDDLKAFHSQNLILDDETYFKILSKEKELTPQEQKFFDENKVYMNLRNLLTYYGTYVCRGFINDKIWINAVLKSNKFLRWETNTDNQVMIITDVRFKEEYDALKEKGATIIKIENQDNQKKVDGVAESHYKEFVPDYIFINDMKDPVEFLRNFRIIFKELFPGFFKS